MNNEFLEAASNEAAMDPQEMEAVDSGSEGDPGKGEGTPAAAICEKTEPTDPADHRDLEHAADDPETPAGELEKLRQELTDLKTELQNLHRTQEECAEFAELFPDTPIDKLPDAVWEDVGRGIPVSAAYALFERRSARAKQIAEEVNLQNRFRSPGALGSARSGFLTLSEVRSMSPAEVRKNYQRILQSMQKWN